MILCAILLFFVPAGKAGAQDTTITLGSGTQVSQEYAAYTSGLGPVNLDWAYMRFQVVYTAAELIAAGAPASGGFISDFGWRNNTVPDTLREYRVRMAHTNAANSGVLIIGPYTPVYYTSAYHPLAGYDMFALDGLGFYWDGINNLVVDICTGANATGNPNGTTFCYPSPSGSIFAVQPPGWGPLCANNISFPKYVNAWKPQARLVFTTPSVPFAVTGYLPDFGVVCPNQSSVPRSFTLNGGNLTGPVTIGPLNHYTFSATANGTYTPTLMLNPVAGNLATSVYVKLTPTAVAGYNGNITVTGGGLSSTVNVPASGSGFISAPALSANGTAINVSTTTATIAGSKVSSFGCADSLADYGISYSLYPGFAGAGGTKVSGYGFGGNAGDSFNTTLSGLLPGTTYYYRSYATMPDLAVTATYFNPNGSFFTAYPAVTTFPYHQGFNGAGMPVGFNTSEGSGYAEWRWKPVSSDAANGAGSPAEGSHFLKLHYVYAYASYDPYLLYTRYFQLPAAPQQLRYSVWMGANSGQNNLAMQISIDSGATWSNLATYSANPANTNALAPWQQTTINLTPYAGQTVRFRLRGTNSSSLINFCNIGFDDFNIEAIVPLPLNLLSFIATKSLSTNELNWRTTEEASVSHFEIERSIDGRNFNLLGIIAADNKPEGGSYSFQDAVPFTGDNYYRLKLVDQDNTYTYSHVALVTVGSSKPFSIKAFPNPSKAFVKLKTEGALSGRGYIQVRDVTGRILLESELNAAGELSLNLSTYTSGTYFIKYTDKEHVVVFPVSKE